MNTPPRKETESGLYAPVWRKINQLIDYMREISVVHGRNVRVTKTMNGTLLLGDAQAGSTNDDSQTNWRGEWSISETYSENDIVIRGGITVNGDIAILSGGTVAGTWIANAATEAGEAPGVSSKWELYSRFSTPIFSVVNGGTKILTSGIDGSIKMNGVIPGYGSVTIALSDTNGKDIRFREVPVCVNGVVKKMMVLGSDIY